jgi:DNA-binding XRE family transcriptional regulator
LSAAADANQQEVTVNKIKFIRTELGISQYELALASGVPRYVIQLAEAATCMPDLNQQVALARTLGVSVEDLFTIAVLAGGGM